MSAVALLRAMLIPIAWPVFSRKYRVSLGRPRGRKGVSSSGTPVTLAILLVLKSLVRARLRVGRDTFNALASSLREVGAWLRCLTIRFSNSNGSLSRVLIQAPF